MPTQYIIQEASGIGLPRLPGALLTKWTAVLMLTTHRCSAAFSTPEERHYDSLDEPSGRVLMVQAQMKRQFRGTQVRMGEAHVAAERQVSARPFKPPS